MRSASTARPPAGGLDVLRAAAAGCRACALWERATQTVFGEGAPKARVMLVGEQPGDHEDLEGHPFVGPAGQILHAGLAEAGIDPDTVYITNAVKHFKWVPKGPRRLHNKPNRREVVACKPWLDAEITDVDPDVIVCLGATAAQSLLGPDFRLTRHRGEVLHADCRGVVLATIHPSAILRAPDHAAREELREGFVADLRQVRGLLR